MNFIGIDPGQKGAIAVLTDGALPLVIDMPVDKDGKIKSFGVFDFFRSAGDLFISTTIVTIEKAQVMQKQGMQKQGIVSAFNYGVGYGKILSVIELLNFQYTEIHPLKWKGGLGIVAPKGTGKKDKKILSVDKCIELFPGTKEMLYTKKGALKDGRAEAILIAEYGRRNFKNGRA